MISMKTIMKSLAIKIRAISKGNHHHIGLRSRPVLKNTKNILLLQKDKAAKQIETIILHHHQLQTLLAWITRLQIRAVAQACQLQKIPESSQHLHQFMFISFIWH